MDNATARCKDDPIAYHLAFSRDVNEAQEMINNYCYDCPIRLACLHEALSRDEYGIWGGHTRKERAKLKAILMFLGS